MWSWWLSRVQWDREQEHKLGREQLEHKLAWAAAEEDNKLGREQREHKLAWAAAEEEHKLGREHKLAAEWAAREVAAEWAARKVAAVQSTRPLSLFFPAPAAAPKLLKPPGENTGCCSA